MAIHVSLVFTLILCACIDTVVECDSTCSNMMECTRFNIQKVGSKVDSMQSNMAAIVNQLSQIQGALNTSELSKEMQKQNMTLVSVTEDLEHKLKALEDENTELRNDFNNGTEDLDHRMKALEEENEDLLQQLKVLEEENSDLRNDLNNDIQKQNTTFVSKNENIEERVDALEKENTDVRKDLDNEIQKHNNTFVSFHAFPEMIREYSAIGATLLFDSVAVNIGQQYRVENSTFVCPYDAYYMFMVTIQSKHLGAYVMLEGTPLHSLFIDDNDIFAQTTVVVVTLCEAGQRVWVETSGVAGNYTLHKNNKFSSTFFSGSVLSTV